MPQHKMPLGATTSNNPHLQREESCSTPVQKLENRSEPPVCAACQNVIADQFLLEALGKYWHEDCLRCNCCKCRLGEVGATLFVKHNQLFCRRDYLKVFGTTGTCAACNENIPPFEMVMRARHNVYHLNCFQCQQCQNRFCVGENFYLCDNKILCQTDYDERRMFAQMGGMAQSEAMRQHILQQTDSESADGGGVTLQATTVTQTTIASR